MADAVSAPPAAEAGDQKQAAAAATLIQHAWRKHASQRADQLWDEMVQSLVQKQVQEQSRSHHPDQPSAPNKRWQRGAFYAQQLAGKPQAGDAAPFSWQGTSSYEKPDTAVSGGPSLVPRTDDNDSLPAAQEKSLRLVERWAARSKPEFGGHDGKVMDQAYWLELVDKHHRYGSNLKQYHTEWDKAQTQQNFFYWLDRGEGRAVDLPACPRSRLDSEHVTYLTASQRCNYIVDVDSQGRLRYRRNGELADTSPYRWTDLGEGRGIGPLSEKEAQDARAAAAARRSSSESSSASGSEWSRYSSDGDSDAEEEAAAHYSNARTNNTRNPLQKLSTGGWTNKLLRKTIASNTWIYVCNQSLELYIGIKIPGKFQHSSFLKGGRVLSAGLIQAQDGVLRSLSPLSGHYRTGPEQFRVFVQHLSKAGVDLSRCKFSKSLIALGLMEKYQVARKDAHELHSNLHSNARKETEQIRDGIRNLFVRPCASRQIQQG